MGLSLDTKERPDVSIVERTLSELARLVRKLRWIGMQEEAEQMQLVLRRVDSAAILLAGPHDTDLAVSFQQVVHPVRTWEAEGVETSVFPRRGPDEHP